MASFPSADNTDYIRDLLNLCINPAATHKDFCDLLWFSDKNECAEMFERTFGITPFNYSFVRRRTHHRDHTAKIFEHITKPETELGTAMYWITMTIYIIRANISGPNPVNQCIDEEFLTSIYQPLVANLDTYNLSDHNCIKTILIDRIADLTPKIEHISRMYSFCDNFLRTVSCTSYVSPSTFK
jgi:hypothetical protein